MEQLGCVEAEGRRRNRKPKVVKQPIAPGDAVETDFGNYDCVVQEIASQNVKEGLIGGRQSACDRPS